MKNIRTIQLLIYPATSIYLLVLHGRRQPLLPMAVTIKKFMIRSEEEDVSYSIRKPTWE